MRNFLVVVIIVLVGVLFNYQIKRVERQTKESQIQLAFSGVVLEKNSHRGYGIIILTDSKEKFQIAIASDSLYHHADKGDTIIKQSGSNRCLVKRDTTYQCDCYYFSADNE